MIPSPLNTPLQPRPSHTAVENPLTRHSRSVEHDSALVAVPEDTPATAQTRGDSELAVRLAQAMRTAGNTGQLHDIENIPPASTFGQWWSHLHEVMKNPSFVIWASEQGIDLSKPIEINPKTNAIAAMVGGQRRSFSGLEHGHLWTSMMAPIMRAAGALTSSSAYIYSPSNSTWAPYRVVADFYGEAISGQTRESMTARATELEHTKTFAATSTDPKRCAEVLQEEKAKLAEAQAQRLVVEKLVEIAVELHGFSRDLQGRTTLTQSNENYVKPSEIDGKIEQFIRDKMSSIGIPLHANSPFKSLQEGPTFSLEKYLSAKGWNLPKNREELHNLGRTLDNPPLSPLALGNFGGALSWPTPLSDGDREEIKNGLRQNSLGISDLQNYDENKGVLAYLLHNQHVASYHRHDPAKFVQELLTTPKAQALGLALQEKFKGVSTPQSVNDWALAALGITLGQDLKAADTSVALRTSIAGFDMASSEYWSQHPSTMVAGLVQHLVAIGRASAELAPIAAFLLLSSRAPALLVKDIPDKVTYGSHTWVSFSAAVARLEHQAPGSTAKMTFTQVMQRADLAPITDEDRQVEYMAQRDALKDWGVAHGVIQRSPVDDYTNEQMSRVYSEYNIQVTAMREAALAQSTAFPERRKMALEELKAVYGDLPFEKACITTWFEDLDLPGPYSVLDLYLKGLLGKDWWKSSSNDIDIKNMRYREKELPNINQLFENELPKYFRAVEKALGTQVKHLITTLPLEDRKNIEHGKITTLTEYDVTSHSFSQLRSGTKITNRLLLKTELDGVINIYEINPKQNSIRKRNELKQVRIGPTPLYVGPDKQLLEVKPSGSYSANITDETPTGSTPNNFTSERSQYIADTLVQDVNIRKLENEARGVSAFDTEVPFYKKARAFLLSLIPLHSAIKNFQAGNASEGIRDLVFDAFGFVLALGAAAKGAKIFQAGLSTASKIGQGVRILGRAALGSANPLSGIDDLARGLVKGGRAAFHKVHKALTQLDSVLLAKKPGIAEGVLKTLNSAEDIKLFAKLDEATGNWHAIDLRSGKPYGKPLENFKPKVLSSDELSANIDSLYKTLDRKTELDICYSTALRAAQADKKITNKTFNTLIPEVLNGGSARYNTFMGINSASLKDTSMLQILLSRGSLRLLARTVTTRGK